MFIISSTTNSIINEYLERQGILNYFTEVFGCDAETSKVKKFKTLFKKYKILPAEAIFISDTAGDIKEAKQAKVNFIIGVLGGYQAKATLEQAQPEAIAKDFDDFFKIIQEK